MAQPEPVEPDTRFPSGKWVGFFTDKRMPGKHSMELLLTFRQGKMAGEGRDLVGEFRVEGEYHLDDGRTRFDKTYAAHAIDYSGFNEGKGIWGTWEIGGPGAVKGGFHIWPHGMGTSTDDALEEEKEIPWEDDVTERELLPAGAGIE